MIRVYIKFQVANKNVTIAPGSVNVAHEEKEQSKMPVTAAADENTQQLSTHKEVSATL